MVACSGARSLCARGLKACVSAALAQQGICTVILHAVTRIRSTKIAELSFIPLVTQGQSLLPCLSNHVLSSRILCGSMLSRTSSGNHCRSDPVQVQSTQQCSNALARTVGRSAWRCFASLWKVCQKLIGLFMVTPKGVQPPALCHASATRESP